MKKKILALVLSLAFILVSVPFVNAQIVTVEVDNVDGTTSDFKYDNTLYTKGVDKAGDTIFTRNEDGFVFYPDTKGNNGFNYTLLNDKVKAKLSNGLEVDKYVTQFPINEKGEYTITMEAFTTGEVTKDQFVVPTDIILVLDQSGSMYTDFADKNTDVESKTRQYAMKTAVNAFIDSVYHSATTKTINNEDGTTTVKSLKEDEWVEHRIAFVTFDQYSHIISGGKTNETSFEVVTQNKEKLQDTIDALPKDLDEALDECTYADEKGDLQTATHLGMQSAEGILQNDDKVIAGRTATKLEEQRNSVVVVFSDGVPSYSGKINDDTNTTKWWIFSEDCADAAITSSYNIKNTYKAPVYSVGIIADMDADIISGSLNNKGVQQIKVGTTWINPKTNSAGNIAVVNRFFNFLSSNSPDAKDLGADSTGRNKDGFIEGWEITDKYTWENEQYFKAADDVGSLTSLFEDIASNVSSATVDLPKQTQVHDYLSDYFEVPDGFNASDVTVYRAYCNSASEDKTGDVLNSTEYTWNWSTPENIKDEVNVVYKKTESGLNEGIVVEGFDFNANFVSVDGRDNPMTTSVEDNFRGAKLIIQFNVLPTNGFIGGNDVSTNASNSGIYAPVPKKDSVTGEIEKDENGNVVYSGQYTAAQTYPVPDTNVMVDYDITTNDQTVYLGNQILVYKILELDGEKVNGRLNEFVNIEFTMYPDGTIDKNGDFTRKLNGQIVHQQPDKYYYMDNGTKYYAGQSGKYDVVNGNLEYILEIENEDGTTTKKEYPIEIEPGYFYYEDSDGNEVKLEEGTDEYNYYKNLAVVNFLIPHGISAEDASKININAEQSILPAETTSYDLRCFAVPNDEKDPTQSYLAENLNGEAQHIVVHVLQPLVSASDIYVDFGAIVNVRLDGTSPIDWKPVDDDKSYEIDLYNANAEYAPTVFYIYHNTVTNEYFKSQYRVDWNNDGDYKDQNENGGTTTINENKEEIGKIYNKKTWDGIDVTYKVVSGLNINVQSEKQYEIVAIQTLSSDGCQNIAYWSKDSDVFKNLTVGGESVTDNNKTNVYINEYDVDITKTVTTTQSKWETYPQSFIFEFSQTAYDHIEDLAQGTTPDATIDDVRGNAHDIKYRTPDKTEVVMLPSEFKLVVDENGNAKLDAQGNVSYTCTKTVSNLRAGLDAIITENEDWSWRYELTSTSVDTIIPADTIIDRDIILTDPITLREDTTLSESSTIAPNSVLQAGTTVSGVGANSVIVSAGTKIATDVIINSDGFMQSIDLDLYLSDDVTIADESTLKIGTKIESGSTFAKGTVFYPGSFDSNQSVKYFDEQGVEQTIKIGDYIKNKSYTLPLDITLSSSVVTSGDVTVSGGTVLNEGTLLKAGNKLANGTKIPSGSTLVSDTTLTNAQYPSVTLPVGIILVKETAVYAKTELAAGTILTSGTKLPGDVNISEYGTSTYEIEKNAITVNYTHNLWVTGYENDAMGLDTNKNGFNDSIVDITGDGIPNTQAFVYRDRNEDSYTDIDVLAPFATETQIRNKDYTNIDITFDMNNDGFIDLIVNASAPDSKGRRKITAGLTAHTVDYFEGFYINENGNIETESGHLVYSRTNDYFDGYYAYMTADPNNENYGLIVGGNGHIYKNSDTKQENNLSATKDFYIISADGVDEKGDGSVYDEMTGVANLKISTSKDTAPEDAEYYGTGRVILADVENLKIFNRDGIADNALEALPISIRDTYRYINLNGYLVFTNEYKDSNGNIVTLKDGKIDTNFTNEIKNDKWLSSDDAVVNKFNKLAVLGGAN